MRINTIALLSLLCLCLALKARAEAPPATAPVTQQFIYNCGAVTAPAAAPAPVAPAPAPATAVAASASTEELVFGPPNQLALGLGFGTRAVSSGNTGVGMLAEIDGRLAHYLGIEGEGAIGGSTGGSAPYEAMAHLKVQLPFKSPLVDFTPRAGIGYFARGGGMLTGASGASFLAGAEIELFHALSLGAEYVGALSSSQVQTRPELTPLYAAFVPGRMPPYGNDTVFMPPTSPSRSARFQYGAVSASLRLSRTVRLGAKVTHSELGDVAADGRYATIEFRF